MCTMELNSNILIHRIGAKIRENRKEKKIRLIDLAEGAQMSSAMMSKIENGRIIPTIPKLLNIINFLEITPEDFFAEINGNDDFPGFLIIKKKEYKTYVKEETAEGFHYESIIEKNLEGHAFQISLVTLEPNNYRPKVSTAAYEFIFLIEGEIEYHIGDKTLILEKGDSFFFDGSIPHVPMNKSNKDVKYIVIFFFSDKLSPNEVSGV